LSYPCHEGITGEQRYSSTHSLPWPLNGEEWSTPHPGLFTPREESPYPLNKRLGGPTACLDISEKREIACPYWGPKSVSCSL